MNNVGLQMGFELLSLIGLANYCSIGLAACFRGIIVGLWYIAMAPNLIGLKREMS